MDQIIKVVDRYLTRLPALAEYLSERPGISAYMLVEDQLGCGIVLADAQRIYQLHVPVESQRGGYGTRLVEYCVNSLRDKTKAYRTTIDQSNTAALALFHSVGFKVVGFTHGLQTPAYVLEYKPNQPLQFKDTVLQHELLQVLDQALIVDAVPIYL